MTPRLWRIVSACVLGLIVFPAALSSPSPLHAAAPVSRRVLPGGLTVLVKENPTADLVATEVLVRAGPRVETAEEAGISSFVQGMVLRGTERRSATEIALAVEGVGGVLRTGTATDYSEYSVVSLSRYADVALDVLADLVTGAKFDPADVETQRRISLSRIRSQADQPLSRALDLIAARLYGMHPYATPLLGTLETAPRFTRDQLLTFYRTFYTAPNMVIVVAGHVTADDAVEKVRRSFGRIRAEPLPPRIRLLPAVERALAPRPTERQEVRETQQTSAAWIVVGYLGVEVGHRDWTPLRVLSGVLGEGGSSRLFVDIREKQGLAYQVGSSFPTRAGPNMLLLLAGTDPATAPRLLDGLLEEVTRAQREVVPAQELERAKQRIIGRHLIDHEDLQRQAFLLGFYELLGAGFAFDARLPQLIARVTAAEVQRVAQFYLQYPTVAVVAPPAR